MRFGIMLKLLCVSLYLQASLQSSIETIPDDPSLADPIMIPKGSNKVIADTKRIIIEGYPKAFNPSLFKTEQGFLLMFRNVPDVKDRPWISDMGVLLLDEDLNQISDIQLLYTRRKGDPTPQQSEDARLFAIKDQLYVIYNDNVDVTNASQWDHRDMFIAKLNVDEGLYSLGKPSKLVHIYNYATVNWQKNWMPFDYNGSLLLAYSINPHEVLYPDLMKGVCSPLYKTKGKVIWFWGKLRGGTPPQLVDGRYLAFFHSPILISSESTGGKEMMHYFMGAYTFSSQPPFHLLSISKHPIVGDGFYTPSELGLRCIYPGGFIDAGDKIYLAYGKDDREVWIATIDKKALYDSMVPVSREIASYD